MSLEMMRGETGGWIGLNDHEKRGGSKINWLWSYITHSRTDRA